MSKSKAELLLDEIGQLLMTDPLYPREPTLLYTEVGNGWTGQSIFKELGNQLLFRWLAIPRLTHALIDLWAAQDKTDRWSELEYVLRDGRFEVSYFYPDEIDPEEDVIERRDRSLRRHFGDKPIFYPSLPEREDDPSLTLQDV